MAKKSDDFFLDGTLDRIAGCIQLSVCSAEPVDHADIANVVLAEGPLVGGDFTVSDGDTSGRKVRMGQQADLPINTSGSATHVVQDDGTNIHVTTCPSQQLTSGGTVTVPAYDTEIADPT
ncbi:hypothetical protein [Sediminicurvatus halobius]|uniref:Uncharacterized protein n=1 Tax=Sediminicurvatus halobius TaxID=2182432 RepID=A0A2U2MXN9_9GAMM|nr:hypothetical protein [Spiribacter halobius]PWG61761.1 hypothetical protein DEM34_14950 [Spiribacter halobius]UEX76806.1 hypothetical protein LMH63_12660 [Spiribacter halobius]